MKTDNQINHLRGNIKINNSVQTGKLLLQVFGMVILLFLLQIKGRGQCCSCSSSSSNSSSLGAQSSGYHNITSGTFLSTAHINRSGSMLTSSLPGTVFQWYLENLLQPSYTTQTINILPTETGNWKVTVTTSSGCSVTTPDILVPPANDDAPGALMITVGAGCSGDPYTNAGATQSVNEPFAACKGTAGYKTVWFKFLAPASGNVRIIMDNGTGTMGTNSRIALFSTSNVNNYASFSNLACSHDDQGFDRSIIYYTGLTAGTYYIQVDGLDGSTPVGTFCLTVDDLAASMLSTSTTCTPGRPLTNVNDSYPGWLSATDANGKLVALISNPSGGATTSTSTYTHALNINSGAVRTEAVSGQKYLDRNFTISNPGVSNVNMQLFFLNTELAALQAAEPAVPALTLASLQVTRQTGATCDNNFIAANGTNSSLSQTANYSGSGFSSIYVTSPGLSKFFIHRPAVRMPVKVWLQGAYNTTLARHRNNTSAWVGALNAGTGGNALSQPYTAAPFSYAGTESVSAGFFVASASTTAPVDWVFLELRNGATPATVIAQRAAFARVDGRIVDLDTTSDVLFRGVPNGNYHLVVRHRDHVAIRTATSTSMSAALGSPAPTLFDFTAASQAFDNGSLVNRPMKEMPVGSGVYTMWAGNSNGMTATAGAATATRASGGGTINDYLFLVNTALGGNTTAILANRYHPADMNMDGTIRASGGGTINDYLFLVNTVLGGNAALIVTQHQ